MTHKIIGSEAGRPIAHVNIREIRNGRRRPKARMIVAAHLAALPIGGGAAAIDSLIIGQPVCFTVLAVAYLAWCFWPSR
ncbi:hypothetical protein [uncultured Brevundimonas sp.]|uniref:hypothetical protein n=1 Tax=uncultured Brevundimonas sp. TaxID=213418 RepID=UPI0025E98321|nr:hypothetical protein [uncultured Brevundimonas sp.]